MQIRSLLKLILVTKFFVTLFNAKLNFANNYVPKKILGTRIQNIEMEEKCERQIFQNYFGFIYLFSY